MSKPEEKFDAKAFLFGLEDRMKALDQKMDGVLKVVAEATQKPPSAQDATSPGQGPSHTHWKAEDLTKAECPECKAEVEKIEKAYLKKVLSERKDYPYECVECGTPVQEDEKGCPTCGESKARKRR